MSNDVHAAGKRGPGPMRAKFIPLTLGCALLGGCSISSDRFSSFSLDSGYEAAKPAPTETSARQTTAAAKPATSTAIQRVSYQPTGGEGFRLASAGAVDSGALQVSRVDLPPLKDQARAPGNRVKTADGYGPYNKPPLADGVYSGPRVYTPSDLPRDEAVPPPPYPEPRRYDDRRDEFPEPRRHERDRAEDREAPPPPPPPPPSFYRRSGEAPAYDGHNRDEARVYEPKQERPYREERDYREAPPRREASRERFREIEREEIERQERHDTARTGPEIKQPFSTIPSERGEGKVVTVAPGETLHTLAIRHGVTVDMIVRANGLSSRYVRPGQDILIPRAGPASYAQDKDNAKAQHADCTDGRCYTVKPGETVAGIAQIHGIPAQRIIEANNLTNARSLHPGQTLVIPGKDDAARREIASAAPDKQVSGPRPQENNAVPPSTPGATSGSQSASVEPSSPNLRATPDLRTPSVQSPPVEASCEAALASPIPRAARTFRKPVEGMTIAQFGPQRDGTVNEGVTISVPKGTPIKAAENGVVAYVGDELPGFGNLILIRHADEYVTAYAHADQIMVKKCDVVKRGQQVATAGTTGDASQPQLHFEIRKNSKPIDPTPLLGS